MKKTIWIIAVASLLLSCLAGHRRLINRRFLKAYEQSTYLVEEEKKLLSLNLEQSYLPYYNMGNAMYRQGSYPQAKVYYERALEQFPWHPDECRIRVNLALTMIAMIDFEGKQEDIVSSLLQARAVLTEENCAHDKDDGGHSKEAEQLKKEIDEMLQQIGGDSSQQQEQQEEEQGQGQDSSDQNPSSREQYIKDKLEGRMQENLRDRNQTQDAYDQMNGEGGGWNYGGKTW